MKKKRRSLCTITENTLPVVGRVKLGRISFVSLKKLFLFVHIALGCTASENCFCSWDVYVCIVWVCFVQSYPWYSGRLKEESGGVLPSDPTLGRSLWKSVFEIPKPNWIIQSTFLMNNRWFGTILLGTVEPQNFLASGLVPESEWRFTLGRMQEVTLLPRGMGKMDFKTGN